MEPIGLSKKLPMNASQPNLKSGRKLKVKTNQNSQKALVGMNGMQTRLKMMPGNKSTKILPN
jgi:hypothetical protein